jgi:glutaredoxin
MPQPTASPIAARAAALLALTLAAAPGPALALFKVVAPDGSVTYTDRPPPRAEPASGRPTQVTPLGRPGAAPGAAAAAPGGTPPLPAELRQPVQRHPVTLFTAADCPPCDAARTLLQRRGVPYAERRVSDLADIEQLERRVGARTVPALTVGEQPLRGFSPDEWDSYLDAAGYPRQSRLPAGWQPPPVQPLAERRPAPPPEPEPAPAPPPPALPSGGIRF